MSDLIQIIDDESSMCEGQEEASARNQSKLHPWKVLVVDDDEEVLHVTNFVLHDLSIMDRELSLLFSQTAGEAKQILAAHPDVACALIDVVMETDKAGLDLVEYMRASLGLSECRIILRTGQPGYAPELAVIKEYDINDYRMKSELTQTRLVTSVTTAIRSFEQLHALSEYKKGLELIVHATSDLIRQSAIKDLAEGVVTQMAAFLNLPAEDIIFVQYPFMPSSLSNEPYIVGAAGSNAVYIGSPLSQLPAKDISDEIRECIINKESKYGEDSTIFYLQASDHQDAAIFLKTSETQGAIDRRLLDVFMANIAACYRNVKLVESLDFLAYHDTLTELLNRQGFIAKIEGLDYDLRQSVALLNIRHFTDVNNGLGDSFGDSLLKAVADRLRNKLDPSCAISRIGADLFGLLGDEQALTPERIEAVFSMPFSVGDYHIPVSPYCGIVGGVTSKTDQQVAFTRANIALNLAKQDARSPCALFASDMEESAQRRVVIIDELRKAIQDRELEVWYQPQVEIRTGKPIGAEALIRWPGENGFKYPPSVFIPLAEYSGLITEIGEWVLAQACSMLRKLRESGIDGMRIAVNVSMPQFRNNDFVAGVARTLGSTITPPGLIELEITESIAMDDPDDVRSKLSELKRLGITVAVDDFGTGYSSLGQLRSLPVDYLKIDRAFVVGIEEVGNRQVAETIVNLCKKLGLKSIAEGIENKQQAGILDSLGCDIAQGFYFARPMPAASLMKWAIDGRTR